MSKYRMVTGVLGGVSDSYVSHTDYLKLAGKLEAAEVRLKAAGELPQHCVMKDEFSQEYIVVSCGVRNGKVIYADELEAALKDKSDE